MALCYLEAIHSKVPDLVQKEKMGEGVQGELDLSGKIVQGDLNADTGAIINVWCQNIGKNIGLAETKFGS
jgi:hypothetical protein